MYAGVLSLFVKFSRRSKNIKFVNIPIFVKKTGKYGRFEKLREEMTKIWKKKLSDKNDPYYMVTRNSATAKAHGNTTGPATGNPKNLAHQVGWTS